MEESSNSEHRLAGYSPKLLHPYSYPELTHLPGKPQNSIEFNLVSPTPMTGVVQCEFRSSKKNTFKNIYIHI